MEYTEVDIRLKEVIPYADILAARLNEIEFESYTEDEGGVKAYVGAMNNPSEILLSGFLKEDIPLILEKSEQLGLELVVSKHKNKWQMLHLKRA